jgi:DNA-binding CsgD family transcriptional regulator
MTEYPDHGQGNRDMSQEQIEPLSERELELVQLLSQGLSNRQIARELCISPNTVKVHLRNIYTKLNVSSRTEATVLALKMGWVEIERPGSEPIARPESTSGEPEDAGEPASAAASATLPQEAVAAEEQLAAGASAPKPASAPLVLWQRVYLVFSAVLVALGLWLIWPGKAERPGPFLDRPAQASGWSPVQVSRWKGLPQMPTPRSRLAVVACQGSVYAIAGESAAGVSGVVEAYSPDTDAWVRKADKTVPVANVGAVSLGDKIYVPGGSTSEGQISSRLEVYDPQAGELGTWSEGHSLPKGVSAYAIAAYQDELYLFGGWDGSVYVAEAFKYDPRSDAWSLLAEMKTRRAFAGAGTIGDRIYVVGGYDGQSELPTCEVYDPAANSWGTCPPLNAPRGGVGVGVIGDTLYVIGGGWESYLVENEYFSPAQGAWQTFPSPLLREWRNLGVAANGTFLYAIGGWDSEFLGVNQAYRAVFRLYMPGTMGQQDDQAAR